LELLHIYTENPVYTKLPLMEYQT